mmetsp:Transcript_3529/g.10263  ORF Transcript_3529/g.10263 Transcript_3529/m.10263 type:complete len:121 (-) Transcript_3529:103-465(-)
MHKLSSSSATATTAADATLAPAPAAATARAAALSTAPPAASSVLTTSAVAIVATATTHRIPPPRWRCLASGRLAGVAVKTKVADGAGGSAQHWSNGSPPEVTEGARVAEEAWSAGGARRE